METDQETEDVLNALRHQAEPTHPPKPEIAKNIGIGMVRANVIFYRSPDGPDEPDARLAA
jgi:hypothetical protein